MTVTEPGVYNIDEAEYHGDPVPESSLSTSGAKALLDSPAKFRHQQTHRVDKPEYDFGHVAHRLILGSGVTPWIVDAADWRTKAAQDARKEARAAGLAPILRGDYAKAVQMAREVRRHPIAGRLFGGDSEVSMFARDPETHLMMRARADHLTRLPNGRPLIVDYKTVAQSAAPRRFGSVAYDYGYDVQDPWYRATALGSGAVDDDPAFLFVAQEKTAPYLVTVIELTDRARQIGAERGRYARHLYVECMTTGQWPGYPPIVHPVDLPAYATAPLIPEGVPA